MANKRKAVRTKASQMQSHAAKSGGVRKGSKAARAQSIADKLTNVTRQTVASIQSTEAKRTGGVIKKNSIVAEMQSIVDTSS